MIKQIMPLSLIVALRFFGLFIVLPVLSIYALDMPGATPFLAGLVVGGYALTQAAFQVPFGMMSDKFGRKQVLFFGLIIFIIGSVVAALSDNIYMLLIGRFLQGQLSSQILLNRWHLLLARNDPLKAYKYCLRVLQQQNQ